MPRTEHEKEEAVGRAFNKPEHAAHRLEFLLAYFAPQESLRFWTLDGAKGMEPAFGVLANWLKSDQCHVTSMYFLSDQFDPDELASYLAMLNEAKTIKVLTVQSNVNWYRTADEQAKSFRNDREHVSLQFDRLIIQGWIDSGVLRLLKEILKPPQYINHLEFSGRPRQDVDPVALDEYIREVQASIPTKSTKAARRPD